MAANSKDFRCLAERWIVCHLSQPAARLQLFCFPHAGGGASYYRAWPQKMPENIKIYAVQLPGRENRMRELSPTNLQQLVGEMAKPIQQFAQPPYAYYGHSMGALLAFELARHQTREKQTLPCHLFVSGHNAPQLANHHSSKLQRHLLPHDEFVKELRRMRGTPAEILNNRELMQAVLPTIRTDFSMLENYLYTPGPQLDIPIHVFGGSDDHFTTRSGLEAWAELSTAAVQTRVFHGDHFFVATHRKVLLRSLAKVLRRYVKN